MAETLSDQLSKVPGLPAAPNGRQTFTLIYLHGRNHNALFKHFHFSGTLKEAVERGKKHCEVMGYRFLRIDPFISDLDGDERFRMDNA